MKKTFLVVVILAVVAVGAWLFLRSQDKALKLKSHVPSESTLVVSADLISLYKKADGQGLKNRELWKTLKKELEKNPTISGVLDGLLENPESSGIDFRMHPMFFLIKQEYRPDMGMVLGLKDQEAFSGLIKKIHPNVQVEDREDMHVLLMEEKAANLVWNDKVAVLYSGSGNDGSGLNQAIALLKEEAESLDDNVLFTKSMFSGKDIQVYVNYTDALNSRQEQIQKKMGVEGPFAISFGLEFEKGTINIEGKSAFENNNIDKWTKVYKSKSEGNRLGLITKETPIAAIQINLDMEQLFDRLLESEEIREGINNISEEAGVERKELRRLFSGELALCFSGVKTKTVNTEFLGMSKTREIQQPQLGLFIGIRDRDVLKKLMDKVEPEKRDGVYTLSIPFVGDFHYVSHPEGLVYFYDREMAVELASSDKLSEGKFEPAANLLEKHGSAAYLEMDTSRMENGFRQFVRKEMKEEYPMFGLFTEPFSNISFWSESTSSHATVTLKRNDRNSLIELLDMSDKLLVKQSEIEQRMEEEKIVLPEFEEPEEIIEEVEPIN